MNSRIMIRNKSIQKNSCGVERFAYWTVMAVSITAFIYLLSVKASGSAWLSFVPVIPSNMGLPFFSCFMAAAAVQIPTLLKKVLKISLPDNLSIFFYAFVLCATVLGEVFDLYYRIPVWDDILHLSSGIMIGLAASILVTYFMKEKKIATTSPVFIAVITLCCAMAVGVVWEVFEFTADYFMGFNMQKFMLQDGTELIGQVAILDTMTDLILDSCGAGIAAMITFSAVKRKKDWLYSYEPMPDNTTQLPVSKRGEKAPLRHSA